MGLIPQVEGVCNGASTSLLGTLRSKTGALNRIESSQAARTGLDLIARDVRCAGYGADLDYTANPQPAIAYIDSMQVLVNINEQPHPDTSSARGWPLAYNPAGSSKPFPFNGTTWAPPIRYRTGAETIRWTLDTNNDGVVNASDMGPEAMRTRNPKD